MPKVKHDRREKTIAVDGSWELVETSASVDRNGIGIWRSFKLYRRVPKSEVPKRTWLIGWNGGRTAQNADWHKLTEHEPERAQWVLRALEEV
jgi:hypothetical protein